MTTLFACAFAAIIVWGCFMFLRWCWRMAVKAARDIERFNALIAASAEIMDEAWLSEQKDDLDG